jgi:hypothetical protein
VVHALFERGVGRAAVRRTIAALGDHGAWPLLAAPLATTDEDGEPRIVLQCGSDGVFALLGHDWQRLAVKPPLRPLRPPGAVGLLAVSDGRRGTTDGP